MLASSLALVSILSSGHLILLSIHPLTASFFLYQGSFSDYFQLFMPQFGHFRGFFASRTTDLTVV